MLSLRLLLHQIYMCNVSLLKLINEKYFSFFSFWRGFESSWKILVEFKLSYFKQSSKLDSSISSRIYNSQNYLQKYKLSLW